jgi:hypothetical protein
MRFRGDYAAIPQQFCCDFAAIARTLINVSTVIAKRFRCDFEALCFCFAVFLRYCALLVLPCSLLCYVLCAT